MSAKKTPLLKKLTPMTRAFITAYIEDLEHNATRAAITAGFSKKTAQEQSSRLLKNPIVKEEIERRLKAIEVKADVTVADVISELRKIGFVDIRNAYGELGGMLPINKMPEDVAHAIAGVDTEELFQGAGQDRERIGDTVKLRLHSKVAALELIGRHLKMFTDKVQVDFADGVFDRLERARENAKQAR